MALLQSIGREILGLFVDDWAFALALVVWVGMVAALRRVLPPDSLAPLLAAGLIILVLIFALRRAKSLRPPGPP